MNWKQKKRRDRSHAKSSPFRELLQILFYGNSATGRSPSKTLCFSSYLLSFAAGAVLYVVVEELIPEMSQGQHSNVGTVFFAVGFSVMMVLDVALG